MKAVGINYIIIHTIYALTITFLFFLYTIHQHSLPLSTAFFCSNDNVTRLGVHLIHDSL